MTGWDVFTGRLMLARGTRDELSQLQAALPGYDLVVTSHAHAYRFEAVRLPDGPQAGPWCVVSSDLADLRRELNPWTHPAPDAHTAAGRAPDRPSPVPQINAQAQPRRQARPGPHDSHSPLARSSSARNPPAMTSRENIPERPDAAGLFDTSRPNIARAYDYLLGGKDNFAADRKLADTLVDIYPGVRQMVRENRRFLVRALDYTLAQAISQYVDLGAGLPTSPAVHEVVRRYDNTAPVVYVDNDPVVISHLRALACSADDHVDAIPADVTGPATVLAQARDTGRIDLEEPVCLILAMVLHFMDAPAARSLVTAYVDELAPGSHVIITVGGGDPSIGDPITRAYDAADLHNHSAEQVATFFTGLNLVAPGITDARAWQPGWRTAAPFHDRAGQILAGIGVKP